MSTSLLLWPYRYNKNYVILPLSKIQRILSYFLSLTIILYFAWTIYGKIEFIHHRQFNVEVFTDIAFEIPVYLLAVVSIASSNNNGKHETIKTFFEELDKIDKNELHLSAAVHSDIKKQLKSEIAIFYLLNITSQLVDIAMFVTIEGFDLFWYYIGNYIMHNFLIVIFFQIRYKAIILHHYFKVLNEKLCNLSFSSQVFHIQIEKDEAYLKEKAVDVRRLCLVFRSLCNQIDSISNTYGIQMILLICCILSIALNCLFYGFVIEFANRLKEANIALYIQISNQIFVASFHFVSK